MQSHLPSCWAALYLTAWWPPSRWHLHLASFALFHFSLGLRGKDCTRPVHGKDFRPVQQGPNQPGLYTARTSGRT